ncbi:MAG: hypothetical protein JST40_03895 [Armatimonadetes bacterium]|nr:hypothetical protein [Armatimonadota bacterium]
MADFIPKSDGNFATWLNNFLSNCQDHAAELALSSQELDALESAAETYASDLNEHAAAQAAALGATATKNRSRDGAEAVVRQLTRQIQSNPNVGSKLKGSLGITIPGQADRVGDPESPTRLVATADSNGTHLLRWQRGQNPFTTVFLVESRQPNDPQWERVGISTATKFEHHGQPIGLPILYRVRAFRAGKLSPVSNEAGVYLGGNSIQLAAA